MFSYNVDVSLNGETRFNLTKGITKDTKVLNHDVIICLAPQFIPLTINSHGIIGRCDEEFDMKKLNYSGTVRDLFAPMPELAYIYNGDEKLRMFCEYAHNGVTEESQNQIVLPASCSFSVNGMSLLRSTGYIKMEYTPALVNKFFATKMSNIAPQRCTSKPESPKIIMFLMNLYNRLGHEKFESQGTLQMPMIRYVPYREAKKFDANIIEGRYTVFYDY